MMLIPRLITIAAAAMLLGACSSDPADNGDGGAGSDADPSAIDAAPSTPDAPPGTALLPDWCSGQPSTFSFFVTSMDALWALSESAPADMSGGFGGNFGGIAGADEICQTIAVATGNGDKTWRAFLSATDDGAGSPVHAIARIGSGPWHDANGRLVASGISGLAGDRPDGEAQSTDDLPDECGVPISLLGDAHDVVTGSNKQGQLANSDAYYTCNDWTSSADDVGVSDGPGSDGLMCGHSFPRAGGGGGGMGGKSWVSDHPLRACGKGANLVQDGPGSGTCIGCTGGYGALYCFAL
jgi:hypothetical protein